MNSLSTENNMRDHALNAHEFLLSFLDRFNTATPGGIHDFMEITLFNMINEAILKIDEYLSVREFFPNPQEIMSIFAGSCQKVLDNIKKNIESMEKVEFK